MIDRTAVSRAIRNITDGPRALPGRAEREIVVGEGGARTNLSEPDEPTHWLAQVGASLHLPRMGAVIDAEGVMHRATVYEAQQYDPRFTSFPYLRTAGERLLFRPPEAPPRLGPTTVWLPFHATYNYGHFVLDALPSLLAAEEQGVLGRAPPIAPPLKPWQSELLSLAFGEIRVTETRAHAVRLEEAYFASSMDNFLHAPTGILRRLQRRILDRAPPGPTRGPRRVYLSRRGWSMRVMLNEAELEAALAARGFTLVHPEELSIPAQINLMREAEVVVAPTGAGLTNAFFAPPQARVIEIQPVGFGDAWVRAFRRVLGGPSEVYACPDAVPVKEVPLKHRMRLGFRFAYRVPLDDFLPRVDAAL